MSAIKTTVLGIYQTEEQVVRGVDILLADGFANDDISVLLPDCRDVKDSDREMDTKEREGAKAIVAAGGAIGGTLCLLVAIGALAVPGGGPLGGAGPLVATVVGIGAGGLVGWLIGGLAGLGIAGHEVKEEQNRDVRVLLSVRCDGADWMTRAKKLIGKTGALDISCSGEASADYPAPSKHAPDQ